MTRALTFTLLFACVITLTACDPQQCERNSDCADGDPCNLFDGVCRNHVCSLVATPACCEEDSDCSDHRFCNGDETCNRSGRCQPAAESCESRGEACNEARNTCGCGDPDRDSDGEDRYDCGGTDCDDDDPERGAMHLEVCDADGKDEDCEPITYGARDSDMDGHVDATCTNVAGDEVLSRGDDCNDTEAGQHPNATEACNGRDDDCDGRIDEGVVVGSWADEDGDGWGTGEMETECAGMSGRASQAGDCDDALSQVHPGAFRCVPDGEAFEIEFCEDDGEFGDVEECPDEGACVQQPDGTGVCLTGAETVTYACSDGEDNDDDGLIDSPADPQCASPLDNTEGPRQCADGVDNDGDHRADFPSDPGCSSVEDGNEGDPATLPACANGVDDDGDGTLDYLDGTGDPGCTSAADGSEREPTGPQCDNGIDDDDDTFTDFPDDPACGGAGPLGVEIAACDDGIDNDGDGNADLNDLGCVGVNDTSERVGTDTFACDDGLDNDGDGASDFPGDSACTSAEDGDEAK